MFSFEYRAFACFLLSLTSLTGFSSFVSTWRLEHTAICCTGASNLLSELLKRSQVLLERASELLKRSQVLLERASELLKPSQVLLERVEALTSAA